MKKMQLSFAVALVMLAGETSAQEISAWFAPSAAKIMRDAKPGASPQAWDLAAAKNEMEACQLVLAADQPLTGVTVTAAPLKQASGNDRLQPDLFRVEYVPIKKEQIPYPDPLPPLTGSFDLKPGIAQPIWIAVRVPKNAAPGVYRGMLAVKAGAWSKEFPLSVKVWDFAIPDAPACVTAFGNAPDTVAQWHGLKPGSPEALALAKKYYEFLLERRLSSYTIPVDLMSPEADAYLNDPRMTSYVIPYKPDEELRPLLKKLIDGNWFSKGFFYVVDEPVKKAAYDELIAVSERLRKLEPRYRLVAPFYDNPDFDRKQHAGELLTGKITIWCPHSNYLESEPNFRKFLGSRGNAGDTIWWYVCNNPREPYNNLQIDQNALAHRVLLWRQKCEKIQGLLYWHTTYWEKQFIADPWQNMDTIGTGFYGDGSLLYPGNKVGIDGPVSSIRLEVLRDGLEDYDFLALAERQMGREAVAVYLAKIVRSASDYERDPLRFEVVRRELGNAIEKSIGKYSP